jgi:hypothetical protein
VNYFIVKHDTIGGYNSSIYRLFDNEIGTDIKPQFMGVNKTSVITDAILEIARR